MLRPTDLQYETFRYGVNQPIHVKATHKPTGTVAEATRNSYIEARDVCLKELEGKLGDHDPALD